VHLGVFVNQLIFFPLSSAICFAASFLASSSASNKACCFASSSKMANFFA